MVNNSGGVSEVFHLWSWGGRVAWRVRYRSMIYSDIGVRSKFCYIAMSIKLHGKNSWHLWICSKIAEKCKKSVLRLKKIESREGFPNREVATRSAKDYVGWDTNCTWHKEQNEGNISCKELWCCNTGVNFSITRVNYSWKEVDTAFLQLLKRNKAEETSVSGPMSAQEAKFSFFFF